MHFLPASLTPSIPALAQSWCPAGPGKDQSADASRPSPDSPCACGDRMHPRLCQHPRDAQTVRPCRWTSRAAPLLAWNRG